MVTVDPAGFVVSPVYAGVAAPVKFVAFPRLMALGVPSAGVTNVGDVANTTVPLPVTPLATDDALTCNGTIAHVCEVVSIVIAPVVVIFHNEPP